MRTWCEVRNFASQKFRLTPNPVQCTPLVITSTLFCMFICSQKIVLSSHPTNNSGWKKLSLLATCDLTSEVMFWEILLMSDVLATILMLTDLLFFPNFLYFLG